MTTPHDGYRRLRPPPPTPAEELCRCCPEAPIKLMNALSFNPVHCLNCNLEVLPGTLRLTAQLAEDLADWLSTYGAIDALELASGDYEPWARAQLLDPTSPANAWGRRLQRRLDEIRRCYFCLWQPQSDAGFTPASTCPICDEILVEYDQGIFDQLLCERCSVVLVGAR